MILALTGVLRDMSEPAGTVEQAHPYVQDITWPRAEDGTIRLTLIGQNRSAVNITGCSFFLAVRKLPMAADDAPTPPAIYRQGVIAEAVNGRVDFTIASGDTLAFVEEHGYRYDVHYVTAAAKRSQVVPDSEWMCAPINALPTDIPS